MGRHKKHGSHGSQYVLAYIVSEIISSDVDESQKSIFWCKKVDFYGSAEDRHPCTIH